jgi:hypothetical protein
MNTMSRRFVRDRRALASALALATLSAGIVGCDELPPSDEEVTSLQSAVVIPGTSVLGFEVLGAWTATSGTLALSTAQRTQGAAALSVGAPVGFTSLTSVALPSGLAPLATLTQAGATVKVDMQIPSPQPNPNFYGALQLFISVPSQGVNNVYLGQKDLLGQQLNAFQTYEYPVPDAVRTKLAGKTYSDLTFTLGLNAPTGVTGKYLFDNLRTTSPASTPVGPVASVDLIAIVTKTPPVNTPGAATFPAGGIQIPDGFHLKLGATGTGTAKLELGFGTTTNITCTYTAAADKKNYKFGSCTTGNKAGDIVSADFAKLTLVSTDPNEATTKVRAQLALNPLGDQLGTKLLPPLPTFWGDTLAEVNTISMAWTNAVIATLPVTSKKVVRMPIPEFAKRKGDGMPMDVLDMTVPPPPNDPPFDFRGDLNNSPDRRPSGMFDAYYSLKGKVEPILKTTPQISFGAHFDATAMVGVRLFEQNIDALSATLEIDTDGGGVGEFDWLQPVGSMSFRASVFGSEVFNETATQDSGFVSEDKSFTIPFNFPPIQIWIFQVQAGITATVGVAISGSIMDNGFQFAPIPLAAVGAHLWGGVNLGIASGGVDVSMDFIRARFPLNTTAQFNLDTSAGGCAAKFTTTVDGKAELSSGGGKIDLVASLGPCPFCISAGWNIATWPGINLGTVQFPSPFPIKVVDQAFPLPKVACTKPLKVTIIQPKTTTVIYKDTPTLGQAQATRKGELVDTDVPCKYLTWTSPNAGAVFTPTTGCNPTVKFNSTGSKTIVVTAQNEYGEVGTSQVKVNVVAKPAGAIPLITSPVDGFISIDGKFTLSGFSQGGSGTVTAVWKRNGTTISTQTVGAGTKVAIPNVTNQTGNGIFTYSLTLTDGSGNANTASVTVTTSLVK